MQSLNLIDQVLDEKYRIERQLGKGGMGAVYLATHLGTGRLVALKVIAPQFMMNDEFVERFKREARAAGRLRHPNVVDVTDFGFAHVGDGRVAYLVMEYLDGCSLAEVLAEESRLPLEWVTDILEQTCSAVDEAHQQGIIHRDLKPDNIWLEPNRRSGYTVKVLDFGLAKLGDAAADEPPVLPQTLTPAPAQSVSERRATPVLSVRSTDQSVFDAATQVQPAPISEEQETRILIKESPEAASQTEEEATRILPPEIEGGATLIQPSGDVKDDETYAVRRRTIDEARARETAPADGLTRVGSILGTPLYMSPEQCRSEPLDARSDIYSLGVIAYQMLTGTPPFKGEMHEVMRLHIEAAPPPIREKNKKIPKKTAAIVMQALAKNPDERPASAAGFASALRASVDGTGSLLRRAFALYSEHFPKFFRVSFVMYLPLVVLAIGQLTIGLLKHRGAIPESTEEIYRLVLGLFTLVFTFLASTVIVGVTIRLVTQLFVAPLRPIQLRPALAALRKRIRQFLTTAFMVGIIFILLCLLLVVPGIIFYINSSLTAPVVMMENLSGRAAMKRSKALVKRSRRTVMAVLFFQYIIPITAGGLVGLVIGSIFKNMPEARRSLFADVTGVITTILNILIVPLISILTALLYIKTRRMGGETLKEMIDEFEEEDVPQTNWQRRMRQRLHTPTQISRQNSSDKN
ncbi:MAG TPA: protein kinase [Blastocatellia bacterium]|nr:protein kinase [Blastocatellia bacterium]